MSREQCQLCEEALRKTILIQLGRKLFGKTTVSVCPVCDVPDREIDGLNIIQIAARNYE